MNLFFTALEIVCCNISVFIFFFWISEEAKKDIIFQDIDKSPEVCRVAQQLCAMKLVERFFRFVAKKEFEVLNYPQNENIGIIECGYI